MERNPRKTRAPFDREQAMLRYRVRRAAGQGLRPEAFPVLAVPASTLPLAPLPAKRRRLYLSHLRRLLRALVTGEALPPPAHQLPPEALVTAAQDRVLQAGCRACKGACCETGGAHAYQTLDDLRRVRAARPALGARGIIALYLAHLPVRTVRGSCVFHGRRGCGLPRELRGEMCNRYLCPQLRDWRERAEVTGNTAAFVLSYDDGLLRGGALVGG